MGNRVAQGRPDLASAIAKLADDAYENFVRRPRLLVTDVRRCGRVAPVRSTYRIGRAASTGYGLDHTRHAVPVPKRSAVRVVSGATCSGTSASTCESAHRLP